MLPSLPSPHELHSPASPGGFHVSCLLGVLLWSQDAQDHATHMSAMGLLERLSRADLTLGEELAALGTHALQRVCSYPGRK